MQAEEMNYDDDQPEPHDTDATADIAAAWDKVENEDADGGVDDGGEGETDTLPDTADTEKPETEARAEPEKESKDTKAGAEKSPAGLSPALREKYKSVPKEIKDWVQKRETDFAVGIQKHAEWAQRAQAMDKVLQPYMPYIQMNGGAQIIPQVLSTAMALSMGPQSARVNAAIDILLNNEIDISLLDKELSARLEGRPQAQQQPMSENEKWLAQFRQEQEQQRQYQQQQTQQGVQQTVSQFIGDPKNEFAEDVRDDMAMLLKANAERVPFVPMSLDDAYDKACRMNPEIQKIRDSRAGAGRLQQRRQAASSIHGAPGGTVSKNSGDDMRSALEAAWDQQGQI